MKTRLTKTQRAFLIDCGFSGLRVTERHGDAPLKAIAPNGFVYGRHTIHTALTKGFIDDRKDVLHLSKEGYLQLPPETAHVLLAIDSLVRCLERMK